MRLKPALDSIVLVKGVAVAPRMSFVNASMAPSPKPRSAMVAPFEPAESKLPGFFLGHLIASSSMRTFPATSRFEPFFWTLSLSWGVALIAELGNNRYHASSAGSHSSTSKSSDVASAISPNTFLIMPVSLPPRSKVWTPYLSPIRELVAIAKSSRS